MDDFHAAAVENIPDADQFVFHQLLTTEEIVTKDRFNIDASLDRAREILDGFPGEVHAIIGHWDFPVSSMIPILCRERGLVSPSLEAVLKCMHKYWSRVEQQRSIPECTPDFCAIDPFAERPADQIRIGYPFWMKPVIGYGSILGFRIDSRADFDRAVERAREKIRRLGEPFDTLLGHADLPREIENVKGSQLIAEQLIGGLEVAPEGYIQDGNFHAHGVIDMVRGPNGKSFQRYEYPSRAPKEVQELAIDLAERVLVQIGFDNGCFNIELFWDEERERLWVIEINPRISQSHSDLFAKVDGMSNHEVAVHVALGEEPHFEHGAGPFRHAAKFLHRRWDKTDALVKSVPGDQELARLRERQPETVVRIRVRPGTRLSELPMQDAYTYTLAEMMIGAETASGLMDKYEEAAALLPFEFEPCET
jgi:biotin carboxylase